MTRTKTLTSVFGALLFLTFVSPVRADVVHPKMDLEKLIYAENHGLTAFDLQSAETAYLYAAHFENNNGKHLGFSVSAVHKSPILGIVRPAAPSSVASNPEPTTMVLLGTGLVAVGALARRKGRRREP